MDPHALKPLDDQAIDRLHARVTAGSASLADLTRLVALLRRHGQDDAVPPVLHRFASTSDRADAGAHAEAGYVLLHVGKTGGTYTAGVLDRLTPAGAILFLPHAFDLPMARTAWPRRRILFGVRAPAEIFVSGFYSRRRRGRPRHDLPWSPEERTAFTRFATPNQLAEGLSAADDEVRRAATAAMAAITHVARGLHGYLGPVPTLRAEAAHVAFVFRQSDLDADLSQFLSRSFGQDVGPPSASARERHSNPPGLDVHLSPLATENLARWYAPDDEIYAECLRLAATRRGEDR